MVWCGVIDIVMIIILQVCSDEDYGVGRLQANRAWRRVTYGLPPEPGHRGALVVRAGQRDLVEEEVGAGVLLRCRCGTLTLCESS